MTGARDTLSTDDLLDAFFAAIERGDIEAVDRFYAEDVEVWHNATGVALDKDAGLALLRYWSDSVTDMHYEVLERRTFGGGAVQRHVIHGNTNGTTLDVPVCIVFHIEADHITRIYEYLDPATVTPVFGHRNAGIGEEP